MSIDRVSISNQSLDPSYAVQEKDQARMGQERGPVSLGQDSVALSSTAKEIDRLSGLVSQSREGRLERVREMIESGTYHVSSEDIARMLIDLNRK